MAEVGDVRGGVGSAALESMSLIDRLCFIPLCKNTHKHHTFTISD
jgi:hypothetical protein